jgi:hypothetical protein
MELTKEHLVNLRDQAMAKRQEYLNMVHQANGAVDMLNLLIEQLDKPETEQ